MVADDETKGWESENSPHHHHAPRCQLCACSRILLSDKERAAAFETAAQKENLRPSTRWTYYFPGDRSFSQQYDPSGALARTRDIRDELMRRQQVRDVAQQQTAELARVKLRREQMRAARAARVQRMKAIEHESRAADPLYRDLLKRSDERVLHPATAASKLHLGAADDVDAQSTPEPRPDRAAAPRKTPVSAVGSTASPVSASVPHPPASVRPWSATTRVPVVVALLATPQQQVRPNSVMKHLNLLVSTGVDGRAVDLPPPPVVVTPRPPSATSARRSSSTAYL